MRASFDIDGVIFMGGYPGIFPGKDDIIVTGRSFEEYPETIAMLQSKGIFTIPYFSLLSFKKKTRRASGIHKGQVLRRLNENGYNIGIHYEDDTIQAREIKKVVPNIEIVLLKHSLVEKENKRYV